MSHRNYTTRHLLSRRQYHRHYQRIACITAAAILYAALLPFGQVAAQESSQVLPASASAAATQDPSQAIVRQIIQLAAQGGGSLLKLPDPDTKLPLAEAASSDVRAWLKTNGDAVINAGPTPFLTTPDWGQFTTRDDKLYIHVFARPNDGRLTIPRLHNSVRSIHVVGGDEIPGTELQPEIDHWLLKTAKLPDRGSDSDVVVVELSLDGAARLSDNATPPIVQPSKQGTIELHARDSITHGQLLRFEPQSHKNTVGYWANEKDWCEWRTALPTSGQYELQLRYGCGDGQGGSTIEFALGDERVTFTVEATGGFQAWRDVTVGMVSLTANPTLPITVRATHKAKGAVMDIQQITLVRKQ